MFYLINLKKSLKNIWGKVAGFMLQACNFVTEWTPSQKKRLFPKFVQVHIKDTEREKAP